MRGDPTQTNSIGSRWVHGVLRWVCIGSESFWDTNMLVFPTQNGRMSGFALQWNIGLEFN